MKTEYYVRNGAAVMVFDSLTEAVEKAKELVYCDEISVWLSKKTWNENNEIVDYSECTLTKVDGEFVYY